MIEDDTDYAHLVENWLTSGRSNVGHPLETPRFKVMKVRTLGKALNRLAQKRCDAILLDLDLPDCSGMQTFKYLRDNQPDIPTVILTAADDQQWQESAVRNGAQDFLIKHRITRSILIHALKFAIERQRFFYPPFPVKSGAALPPNVEIITESANRGVSLPSKVEPIAEELYSLHERYGRHMGSVTWRLAVRA